MSLAPEARSYERSRSEEGHGFTLQSYDGEIVATGELFATTGERGKAIEAVKKAIELNPQDQNCKLALGRILERGTAFNAGNAKSGGSGSIAAKAAKNPI